MQRGVVVIGAGGHAKVCIELLRSMGTPIGYCVAESGSKDCLGVPVLEGDAELQSLRRAGYRLAFPAVGSNAVRLRLSTAAIDLGFELVNAVSSAAVVSPTAKIGAGIAVMAGAVINADTVIGDMAIINTGATVDHDCHIGVAAHIAPQCGLAGNVKVGDRSFLGIGCQIIPGVVIGADVTVGAGSVVIADIPSGQRVAGVPAKPLKHS